MGFGTGDTSCSANLDSQGGATVTRLRSISAELGYCTESARFTFLAKLKISSAASSIQVLTYDARLSLRRGRLRIGSVSGLNLG